MMATVSDAGNSVVTALSQAPFFQRPSATVGFSNDTADFYSVVAPANGHLQVTVGGMTQNLDLVVYDQSGALIGRSQNSGTGDEWTSPWVWNGGVYYVGVVPQNGAASQYSITTVFKPALAAMDVLHQAENHIGEDWGTRNCTGFVYTVSYELNAPFYLTNDWNNLAHAGTNKYGLISNGGNYVDYRVPITDSGAYSTPDYLDQWATVFGNGNDSVGAWTDDVAAGDTIRLKWTNGIYHSAVVAALDEDTRTLYLVDNGGRTPGEANAEVQLSSYSLDLVSTKSKVQVERLETEFVNGGYLGDARNDVIGGGKGNDWLLGLEGDDLLIGNAGNDFLIGDLGTDTLKGGSGADVFVYSSVEHSPSLAVHDVIADFQPGVDSIMLSDIDADQRPATWRNILASDGNQAFRLTGDHFTGSAGELITVPYTTGVLVEGDVNGDALPDLVIEVRFKGYPYHFLPTDIIV